MRSEKKRENYLMQRVKEGADGVSSSIEFDYDAYKNTVFLHLQKIFNTRQGSCLANPNYGLPDFNDLDMKHGFSIAVNMVRNAIKDNIQLYESGLNRVRVKFVQDETRPLDLKFEIVGVLSVGGRNERVRFETKRSLSGFLEVN